MGLSETCTEGFIYKGYYPMRTKPQINKLSPAEQLALDYKLIRRSEFDQQIDKLLNDAADSNYQVNILLLADVLCSITWHDYKAARARIDKLYKAKD